MFPVRVALGHNTGTKKFLESEEMTQAVRQTPHYKLGNERLKNAIETKKCKKKKNSRFALKSESADYRGLWVVVMNKK